MTPFIEPRIITADTRLVDLLLTDLNLLFVLNQFELPMGFGESTIGEICEKHHIDTSSLLILLQFYANPEKPDRQRLQSLDIRQIITFLKNSHHYFLDYRLPSIREQLLRALPDGATRNSLLSYFDEYRQEVQKHMDYENQVFFPYINDLLNGTDRPDYSVKDFESRHNNIEEKLEDLIHLLIKYLPFQGNYFALADALEDIRLCNRDLNLHTFLEDAILVPKIKLLEKKRENGEPEIKKGRREELSDREKEIVKRVAKGMSNKEIAEVLFLSVHTVITHRRNISRKLGIHSSAGLTVYAIINNLIDINELRS